MIASTMLMLSSTLSDKVCDRPASLISVPCFSKFFRWKRRTPGSKERKNVINREVNGTRAVPTTRCTHARIVRGMSDCIRNYFRVRASDRPITQPRSCKAPGRARGAWMKMANSERRIVNGMSRDSCGESKCLRHFGNDDLLFIIYEIDNFHILIDWLIDWQIDWLIDI
jgi:hypothetical protein